MNRFIEGQFDAVVIGAGHAGCEAALALARTGFNTAMLTLNLDSIAFLACNPSIGGTAKGQIVREIDALGGEMGINADAALLQIRMLNRGKGAAVQSLRGQEDKNAYHALMKKTLENTPNLKIVQGDAFSSVYKPGDYLNGVDDLPMDVMITQTMASIKEFVDSVNNQGAFGDKLNQTMAEVRQLSANLNQMVATMRPYLTRSVQNLDVASERLTDLMAKADSLMTSLEQGEGRSKRKCYQLKRYHG